MRKVPVKIVLDTNVLISSFLFGGIPREVLLRVVAKDIYAITSRMLVAELFDTLERKFKLSEKEVALIEVQIKGHFKVVHPSKQISVVRDIDDNRVLEAAFEGTCDFVITGDNDLLTLGKYKNISIVTPSEFLHILEENKN